MNDSSCDLRSLAVHFVLQPRNVQLAPYTGIGKQLGVISRCRNARDMDGLTAGSQA